METSPIHGWAACGTSDRYQVLTLLVNLGLVRARSDHSDGLATDKCVLGRHEVTDRKRGGRSQTTVLAFGLRSKPK
jgi:hypothetical protein